MDKLVFFITFSFFNVGVPRYVPGYLLLIPFHFTFNKSSTYSISGTTKKICSSKALDVEWCA